VKVYGHLHRWSVHTNNSPNCTPPVAVASGTTILLFRKTHKTPNPKKRHVCWWTLLIRRSQLAAGKPVCTARGSRQLLNTEQQARKACMRSSLDHKCSARCSIMCRGSGAVN
jgi:hypothetical protein